MFWYNQIRDYFRSDSASDFSVLGDEICDIWGTEQLSIGVRYVNSIEKNKPIIHEEFLGYEPLSELNDKSISENNIQFLIESGLDLDTLVGQGYDGIFLPLCISYIKSRHSHFKRCL